MPLRSERALFAGLALYSVLILGSQATMSLGIPILLMGAIAGFGGPANFFRAVRRTWNDTGLKRYLWATAAVAVSFLISLFFADVQPLELGGISPDVHWIRDVWKTWYFFWPIVLVPCIRALSERGRRGLMRLFLGAFGLMAAIGCVQFFIGWPRPQAIPGMNYFHVTVFPGHHLSFASIAIFPFFLAASEIFERRWISRRIAILISLLGLAAIFGTYSRQVWISLPIGVFALIVTQLPKRAAIAAILGGILLLGGLFQIPAVRVRAQNSMGIHDRVELWKANVELFKRRPVTGVGWHHNLPMAAAYFQAERPDLVSPFVGHAHSNFFEFLGGMGLIGVVTYFFWTWTTIGLGWIGGGGFFAAWIVFHLNGLTQVNFSESKVLHSMMWSLALAIALAPRGQPEKRE